MSWAEVKKINSDLTTPLNEQLDGVESGLSDEIGAVGTQVEAANEMLEQIDTLVVDDRLTAEQRQIIDQTDTRVLLAGTQGNGQATSEELQP